MELELPEPPPKYPALAAVCRDDPVTLVRENLACPPPKPWLRPGPALAGLQALHLATALGWVLRDGSGWGARAACGCCLTQEWTPPHTQRGAEGSGAGDADDEPYSSYESVCSSPLYQELKALLPATSEFSHTYSLAQLLLRGPCTPLTLAVRFGRQASARMLLAAIEQRQRQRQRAMQAAERPLSRNQDLMRSVKTRLSADLKRDQLSAALAMWSASPDPALSLLRRLLAAGGDPLPEALPAILQRYSTCSHASAIAEKMKAGLQSVLQHVLPDHTHSGTGTGGGSRAGSDDASGGDRGSSGGSGSASRSDGGGGGASGGAGGSVDAGSTDGSGSESAASRRPSCRVLGCAVHLRALLAAAVACHDEPRCGQLLAALQSPGLDSPPWSIPGGSSSLLVSAAAHDMAGVVRALLALPPVHEGGPPPFQPNMWGEDGLSALMAAAHRGALGALGALLEAGATVNLADELGATALHWAVVGGQEAAVMLLAQHGAAIDQAATVHEEEEHLERPMLTAIHAGNLPLARLLHQLGAALDLPSAGGYTPLSVSICWEQEEAARMLLQLGADPNQVLPPEVNGGMYQMWSENYSVEEARTLLGMACSRMDWRVFVEMLLAAGADPTLRHPQTGLTPAAEVAAFGALEEAALLFELSAPPAGPHTLEQLGWAEAMSEAARNYYFYSSAAHPSDDTSLEPLLDAWRLQQPQAGTSPPPAACRSIVSALLDHPALKPKADGSGQLAGGAELSGVMQAERLAAVGICADLLDTLEASPCKAVVLAAAPPAQRWSPARHSFFPPAFKCTARALLLANHCLLGGLGARMQRVFTVTEDGWAEVSMTQDMAARLENEGLICRLPHLGSPAEWGSHMGSMEGRPPSGALILRDDSKLHAYVGGGGIDSSSSSSSSSSCTLRGLPRDALFEVLRYLAAAPLSFWMRQPSAPAPQQPQQRASASIA